MSEVTEKATQHQPNLLVGGAITACITVAHYTVQL